MNPLLHIRTAILGMTQTEMAMVAGVRQGTVSRWERNKLDPARSHLVRIRAEAARRGMVWHDRWFFEVD